MLKDSMGHPYKDTISLQEAIQLSEGPLAFNLMIKPAGSLCSRYMQFMPVVEHVRQSVIVDPYEKDAEIAPWSVSSQGFGRFMCEIFDYWVRNDVGQYFVNFFDATLAGYCGVQPGTCAYASHAGMGICVMESAPYMLKMRELLMNRRPPSDVMTWARAVRDI